MKRLLKIFLLYLFLLNCDQTFGQWYSQNSGTAVTLNSVFFIDPSTGWACGLGTILKTTDCGTGWNSIYLPGNFKSICFTDNNTGWICGENGKLLRTTDGGMNWNIIIVNTTSTLNQISFFNQDLGIIAGNNKTILRTTNAGVNWVSVVSSGSYLNFHSAKIVTGNVIIVSGTESSVYKSTTSGNSWDTLSFGMPNPLLTVEFINESTGWISGCCGMFLKTTNAGINWTPETYLTPGYSIYSIKFVNEDLGWAAGDAGYILRTTDAGTTWDSLNSTTHNSFFSICFLNKDTVFVVGYNGMILKTVNGGGQGFPIGISQIGNEVPEKFYLSQNFPNPFNPNTTISYKLAAPSYVTIKVFNMLGKEIKILVNERLAAGNYEVEFDAANLSSGIYFYKFVAYSSGRADEFVQIKSMVLLK